MPRVKHLTIMKHDDKSLDSLDSIIDKCQNLDSINLGLYPSHSDVIPIRSRERIDLSTIIPYNDIKNLTSTTVIERDNTLFYLMHKFPQLQQLIINEHNDVDDHIDVYISTHTFDQIFSAPLLTQFFNYLHKIPKHSVGYIYPNLDVVSEALLEHCVNLPFNSQNSINFEYAISQGVFNVYSSSPLQTSLEVKDRTPTILFKILLKSRPLPHLEILERNDDFITHLQVDLGKDLYFCKAIRKYDATKLDLATVWMKSCIVVATSSLSPLFMVNIFVVILTRHATRMKMSST